MPIIDYKKISEVAEKHLLNQPYDPKIIRYLKRFLDQYAVKPATLSKFCKNIEIFLNYIDDIDQDIHDRDKINTIFKKIRTDYSVGYYATVINVTLRFVRWINDGERPKGFTDIKSPSKKSQMRKDLTPESMTYWETGLKIAKMDKSLMFKAAYLTQLDVGLRPSEFVDLNYGNIVLKKDIGLINIKDGKTGSRTTFVFFAYPYLMRWMQAHPTKRPDDPLFFLERTDSRHRNKKKNGLVRITRDGFVKRLERLYSKAEIDKPCDIYALRHSSIAIDKKNNVPVDLSAKKHGNSVEMITEVYARLSVDDDAERLRNHYGLKSKKEDDVPKNIECKFCGMVNEPKSDICYKCSKPLTIKKALEYEEGKSKEIETLKNEMAEIKKTLVSSHLMDLLKSIKK